jgi:hypothetical protein
MMEEILEKIILEENLIIINSNIGAAIDFVIDAMQRDPIPVSHV